MNKTFLLVLLALGIVPASNLFASPQDIIESDNRRPITKDSPHSFEQIGRLQIEARLINGNYGKVRRCIVTLISKDTVVTDAGCYVQTTQLAWGRSKKFTTHKEYQELLVKEKKFYSVMFEDKNGKQTEIGIKSVNFASSYLPQSIVDSDRGSHIVDSRPPTGLKLVTLTLDKEVALKPISLKRIDIENIATPLDLRDIGAVSVAKDNHTFLYDDECWISNFNKDSAGNEYFVHSCDMAISMGAPVIGLTGNNDLILLGITTGGSYLSYLTDQFKAMSQEELHNKLNQSCGEDSFDKCMNAAISANEILKEFKID